MTSNYIWLAVVGAAVMVLMLCLCLICIYCMRKKKTNSGIIVKNAMVILIGIGTYVKNQIDPDPNLRGVNMPDLPVDIDLENLKELFGKECLNYTVFQEYQRAKHKIYWTKEELEDYLDGKAQYLQDNMDKFDGLLVIVSAHGIEGHICTSDYKTIRKLDFHRTFSKYKRLREKPRLFIFDCCDGNNQRGKGMELEIQSPLQLPKGKSSEYIAVCQDEHVEAGMDVIQTSIKKPPFSPMELAKGRSSEYTVIREEDEEEEKKIMIDQQDTAHAVQNTSDDLWPKDSKNPDYLLAEIHAANPGFKSFMHGKDGSFLLRGFKRVMMKDIKKGKSRCIYQIIDDIGKSLEKGQQLRPIYYNNTREIKLRPAS